MISDKDILVNPGSPPPLLPSPPLQLKKSTNLVLGEFRSAPGSSELSSFSASSSTVGCVLESDLSFPSSFPFSLPSSSSSASNSSFLGFSSNPIRQVVENSHLSNSARKKTKRQLSSSYFVDDTAIQIETFRLENSELLFKKQKIEPEISPEALIILNDYKEFLKKQPKRQTKYRQKYCSDVEKILTYCTIEELRNLDEKDLIQIQNMVKRFYNENKYQQRISNSVLRLKTFIRTNYQF